MPDTLFYSLIAFLILAIIALTVYIAIIRSRLAQLTQHQARLEQAFNDLSDALQSTVRNAAKANKVELQTLRNQQSEISEQHFHQVEQLHKLQAKLQEFEQRDPEIKLYQQAKKLVASGATVEEVMESCQLSRAEVDLLYSLENAGRTE